MNAPGPRMLYLARARLHRPRANLVQTLRTVVAFARLGINVSLYLPPWRADKSIAERLEEFGIAQPLDVRISPLLHSSLKLWPFAALHWPALRAADVVYVRSVELSQTLARWRLPHILEIHEANTSLIRKGFLRPIVERQRRGLIRCLLPISQAAAQVLLEAGADPRRVHVAPSGVEIEDFASLPPPNRSPGRRPRVVYVGSISRSRGLDVFAALAQSRIAEVTLVGMAEDALPPIPGLLGVPYVPHRDVPGWYAKCDIAVMPYQASLGHADSISPIKLFEAMAAGRPVVVSDLPAIREIVTHGRDALLVPPDDAQAWVSAVTRLRDDPELALRLARAGRETAARYSWARRARGIAEACGWRVGA